MTINIDRLGERLGYRVRSRRPMELTMSCSRKNRDIEISAFTATGQKMERNGLVFYTEVPETTVFVIRWRERITPDVWENMGVYACRAGGYVYNFPGGLRSHGLPDDLYKEIDHLVMMFEESFDKMSA